MWLKLLGLYTAGALTGFALALGKAIMDEGEGRNKFATLEFLLALFGIVLAIERAIAILALCQ